MDASLKELAEQASQVLGKPFPEDPGHPDWARLMKELKGVDLKLYSRIFALAYGVEPPQEMEEQLRAKRQAQEIGRKLVGDRDEEGRPILARWKVFAYVFALALLLFGALGFYTWNTLMASPPLQQGVAAEAEKGPPPSQGAAPLETIPSPPPVSPAQEAQAGATGAMPPPPLPEPPNEPPSYPPYESSSGAPPSPPPPPPVPSGLAAAGPVPAGGQGTLQPGERSSKAEVFSAQTPAGGVLQNPPQGAVSFFGREGGQGGVYRKEAAQPLVYMASFRLEQAQKTPTSQEGDAPTAEEVQGGVRPQVFSGSYPPGGVLGAQGAGSSGGLSGGASLPSPSPSSASSSTSSTSSFTPNFRGSASSFYDEAFADISPGRTYRIKVTAGPVLALGVGEAPIVAVDENERLWLGRATLAGASGRAQATFTRVYLGKDVYLPVTAVALDANGLYGIPLEVKDLAPTVGQDVLRAAISGLSSYLEDLRKAQKVTIGPDGKLAVEQSAPPLEYQILGNVASLFKLPQEGQTVVRVYEVPRGTVMEVLVLGVGEE